MKQPITIDLQNPPEAVAILRENVEGARMALDALGDALADTTIAQDHLAYLATTVGRTLLDITNKALELVTISSAEAATR